MAQTKEKLSPRELVLERIGFGGGDAFSWNKMQWYVAFANRDLTRLTPGDLLNLQEEIRAIAWQAFRSNRTNEPPTLSQIVQLKEAVHRVLYDLLRTTEATYGPVAVTLRVTNWEDFDDEGKWSTTTVRPIGGFEVTGRESKLYQDELMAHMFSLLWRWGLWLKQCPKCWTIFLQFRRHAKYCSRKCQSIAFMRNKRASERGESKSLQIRKKAGAKPKLKEKSHG